MNKLSLRPMSQAVLSGLLAIVAVTACTDEPAATETTTTSGENMSENSTASYTVFPAVGSVPVADRFEVSVRYIEEGNGRFWIDDSDSGDGEGFDLALGESAEFGGWTFEVTHLSEQSAQFFAVSPDGQVFPDQN